MQRGVAYELARSSSVETVGALVVTNDRWNERMAGVGVVPLKRPFGEPSSLTPMVGELQAEAAKLIELRKDQLGSPFYVAGPDEMRAVEGAVCDVLDLVRLGGPSARGPRPVPGRIDYPQWAGIYWVQGRQTGGEDKRYLIVSRDPWNQVTKTPVVVRLTGQVKRPFDEFPEILDGASQACCGEATVVSGVTVDQRNRPAPSRASLGDMVSVARGIIHTHELEGALGDG